MDLVVVDQLMIKMVVILDYKTFTFIFRGDFMQVLTVVIKGSRADIVASSISRASFWCYCNVQHLKINMRLMHSNLSHDEHERVVKFCRMDVKCW